jgi:hypothetical protein
MTDDDPNTPSWNNHGWGFTRSESPYGLSVGDGLAYTELLARSLARRRGPWMVVVRLLVLLILLAGVALLIISTFGAFSGGSVTDPPGI